MTKKLKRMKSGKTKYYYVFNFNEKIIELVAKCDLIAKFEKFTIVEAK